MKIINDLSKIKDLKFIGGTSLFLQNKVSRVKDIDVLVQSSAEISEKFKLTFIECPVYRFPERTRAFFIVNEILVDVFIQQNDEEIIQIGDYSCTTITSQIKFLEKTLEINMSNPKRQKILADINYLATLR
ncbi:hypothetical protein [Chryseobacterium rhizosphaerae]|uniref:hypothetical protein n=1 Tax=Chryseobacterium rhizosphaerae TaxID=395937 RepID=UPI003D0EAEEB